MGLGLGLGMGSGFDLFYRFDFSTLTNVQLLQEKWNGLLDMCSVGRGAGSAI